MSSLSSSFSPSSVNQSITQVSAWWVQWRASLSKRCRKCLRPISLGWSAWSRRWCLIWRKGKEDTSSWSAVSWDCKVSRDRGVKGEEAGWGVKWYRKKLQVCQPQFDGWMGRWWTNGRVVHDKETNRVQALVYVFTHRNIFTKQWIRTTLSSSCCLEVRFEHFCSYRSGI